ncbi:MAG: hypothetical protein IT372_34175 [Polyangiaceae bacterium]|nr:hypothetical protein [Polyangiaceae bacterium]
MLALARSPGPRLRALLLLGLPLALLLGCSASESDDPFGGGGSGSGGSGSTTTTSSTTTGTGGFDPGTGGGGQGGAAPVDAEVFAHSASTLYRLDPLTKDVTVVGNFSGCADSVIDIAIDQNGLMFGTTFSGLHRIDKATAACTPIASGSYPNSLSFVPKGTVDPNVEALVGYAGSSYVRIDTVTGTITTIGALTGGYVSSGDVVSVIGGGTYLTVKSAGCSDCIIEVNPTTGALVNLIGPLGRTDVFGLAFWAGSAYGFNNGGQLFEVDLTTGTATDIPMPNPPPGLSFWGAGSTTAAPLDPPE